MKFWSDDCETYAAESIEDLEEELKALGVVSEEWPFDPEDWREVSKKERMWVDPDVDFQRMKTDKTYEKEIKDKCLVTLEEAFNGEHGPSETGKAFFMCSTE